MCTINNAYYNRYVFCFVLLFGVVYYWVNTYYRKGVRQTGIRNIYCLPGDDTYIHTVRSACVNSTVYHM